MRIHAVRRWFGVEDDLTPNRVKQERDDTLARIASLEQEARLLADEAAAWRALHGPIHGHRTRSTHRD
jgi:hypothetical protein